MKFIPVPAHKHILHMPRPQFVTRMDNSCTTLWKLLCRCMRDVSKSPQWGWYLHIHGCLRVQVRKKNARSWKAAIVILPDPAGQPVEKRTLCEMYQRGGLAVNMRKSHLSKIKILLSEAEHGCTAPCTAAEYKTKASKGCMLLCYPLCASHAMVVIVLKLQARGVPPCTWHTCRASRS